jgi:hypothetical protein
MAHPRPFPETKGCGHAIFPGFWKRAAPHRSSPHHPHIRRRLLKENAAQVPAGSFHAPPSASVACGRLIRNRRLRTQGIPILSQISDPRTKRKPLRYPALFPALILTQ